MRATTFVSGLLLATAAMAVPMPRQTDKVADANPFNIGKRLDLPKLPVDLPALPETDGLTKGLPTLPATGDLTKTLPIKLPVGKRGLPKLPVDLPVTIPELPELPVDVPALPVDAPTVPTLPSTDALAKELPKLPVDIRDLSSVTGALAPVTGAIAPVTAAAGPVVNIVSPILASVLNTILSVDAAITQLENNAKANVKTIIASLERDLDSVLTEVQSVVNIIAGAAAASGIAEVRQLISQIEATAGQLVTDLEKVESTIPSVSSLVATSRTIVDKVQALGL